LRERLQKSFLGGVFRLAAIAKESVRNVEDSGAVSANDLSEGRFIFGTRETRQFKVRRLIVAVRQKRSSIDVSEPRAVATGSMRSCNEKS